MSIARRLLERASRGKTFRRRMPADLGSRPVIVSPDAALRYLNPSSDAFEPELLAVAKEWVRPGDVVWDVGSNLGVFAVAAGHMAGTQGKVLAIEADTWLASLIRKTAQLPDNQDLTIEVVPVAVSGKPGVARFAIAQRGRASNSLAEVGGRATTGGVRESHLVPTLPLDTLREVCGDPQVIKIDVEGAELLALDGARAVLAEARPVVYIEVAKEKSAEAAERLHAAGYVLLDPDLPAAERQPLERCRFNTLAVPRERHEASPHTV